MRLIKTSLESVIVKLEIIIDEIQNRIDYNESTEYGDKSIKKSILNRLYSEMDEYVDAIEILREYKY